MEKKTKIIVDQEMIDFYSDTREKFANVAKARERVPPTPTESQNFSRILDQVFDILIKELNAIKGDN